MYCFSTIVSYIKKVYTSLMTFNIKIELMYIYEINKFLSMHSNIIVIPLQGCFAIKPPMKKIKS